MVPPCLAYLLLFWVALYFLVVLVFKFEPPEGRPVLAFRMPPYRPYLEYLRKAIVFCRLEGVVLEASVTTRVGGHALAQVETRGFWTEDMREELEGLLAGCPRQDDDSAMSEDYYPPNPRRVHVRLHRQQPAWFVDLFVVCLAEGVEFTGTYDTDPKAPAGASVRTTGLSSKQLQLVMQAIRSKKKND